MNKAIIVQSVIFKADRMVCLVKVAADAPAFTTSELADRLLVRHPRLARHACVNKFGTTFGDCLPRTSLPHVLEHLVIDCQVSYDDDEYVGTTEWLDQDERTARIELSYRDDLAALSALRQALDLLDGLLDDDDVIPRPNGEGRA